ncbi:MAG: prephenate dehydrogenase dimerization domain-containing protein, partial [Armatimonadota bacterium]
NENLFKEATWVLTPTKNTNKNNLEKLVLFIESIGAKPLIMDPDMHDISTSIISHLPHIIAATLIELASEKDNDELKTSKLAAGSFADLTRIADSSPEIWRDICITNSIHLVETIDNFIAKLHYVKSALEDNDSETIKKIFENSKIAKSAFRGDK